MEQPPEPPAAEARSSAAAPQLKSHGYAEFGAASDGQSPPALLPPRREPQERSWAGLIGWGVSCTWLIFLAYPVAALFSAHLTPVAVAFGLGGLIVFVAL